MELSLAEMRKTGEGMGREQHRERRRGFQFGAEINLR